MKRLLAVLALFSGLAPAAWAKPKVVTTLPSLGHVTREVGGDRVDVAVLARAGQDPHFVDAKPSFIVELRNADLFVVNGLELEVGWVPPLLEQCRNGGIQPGSDGYLDASTLVAVIDVPAGPVDRSMGDVHALGNPHYMLDPLAVRRVAAGISAKLAALDAEGAETYAANLKAFQRRLDEALFGKDLVAEAGGGKLARLLESGELDRWLADNSLTARLGGWLADLSAARGKEVVAFHTNLNYFWKRFGLALAGTVEPKPGIPPSAGHTAQVILAMKERKIGVVVTQPFYGDSAVKLIAEKTGCRVVTVPIEGDDVLATIGAVAREMKEALK